MYKREDAEYENQHMRDAMLAHTVVVSVGWPSVCLSVCLSDTSRCSTAIMYRLSHGNASRFTNETQ